MKRQGLALIPIILSAGLLASCGGAQLPFAAKNGTAPPVPAVSAAASAQAGGGAVAGAPAQPRAVSANAAAAPGTPTLQGAASSLSLPPTTPLVIKNGSLNITVDEPESALSQMDQLVHAEEGTIASQTIRTQNDLTYVNLVIQVPPGNFEDTLAKVRELRSRGSRVIADSVSTQDVTDQVIDLDAQYRNLQATRDAYQKLLDKATAIQDIITLTREVANIQTQMDQIKARQNLLTRQAGVATINVTLTPAGAPAPGPKPLPRPMQAASEAWQALMTALQGLAVALIWMAVLLPIPAVVLFGGWVLYRRVTRNNQPGIASS